MTVDETKGIKISANFTLYELLFSNTAIKNNLTDQFNPPAEVANNLTLLCEHILQPLRTAIGVPIKINSGYRSPSLNTAIGGSKTSDHMIGKAADIEIYTNGKSNNKALFLKILEMDLPFKQLIWEFGDDNEPNWIHIAYDTDNIKKQILQAKKEEGRTVYVPMQKEEFLGGTSNKEEHIILK